MIEIFQYRSTVLRTSQCTADQLGEITLARDRSLSNANVCVLTVLTNKQKPTTFFVPNRSAGSVW